MENKKTITIVVSSYKYGHLAAHCIESILSQSIRPDKIFFVDDGVGDCFFLKELYPQVDFVFRKHNLGVVDNFDDMLKRVNTDYCMFLGADNWLRSDSIELILEQDKDIITYDIIVTGDLKKDVLFRHEDEMYKYQGDYYWSRKFKHHGSMVYKTKLAQKFGYKARPGQKYTEEDYYLWNNMIDTNATIGHVEEGLLYYRRHRENFNKYIDLTNNKKVNFFKRLIKKFR